MWASPCRQPDRGKCSVSVSGTYGCSHAWHELRGRHSVPMAATSRPPLPALQLGALARLTMS